MALWRISTNDGPRLAAGPADAGPQELLPADVTIDGILSGAVGALADALTQASGEPVPADVRLLPPIESQEVWASGVTYLRSRDARMEESAEPDVYDQVYEAERPELFFKATGARVRGPGAPIGIRIDSTWDVPEAELGLVLDARGGIVGYVAGNDVSSRSIEGDNPLYLPQAKCYTGSCAIGPCIVPVEDAPDLMASHRIGVRIERGGEVVHDDDVALAQMHRTPAELADWLYRALEFPVGAVLLTGTGIVPSTEFSLLAGDAVTVWIEGLGALTNPVELVGPPQR